MVFQNYYLLRSVHYPKYFFKQNQEKKNRWHSFVGHIIVKICTLLSLESIALKKWPQKNYLVKIPYFEN